MKATDQNPAADTSLDIPAGYRIADVMDPFEMRAGPYFCTLDGADDPHLMLITNNNHCNRLGPVHGGCLMTMMDLWLCQTAVTGFKHQEEMVTISMTSTFVGACFAGDTLIARAQVLKRTHRTVFVQGQITRDDDPVFSASAVLKRARKPQPDP